MMKEAHFCSELGLRFVGGGVQVRGSFRSLAAAMESETETCRFVCCVCCGEAFGAGRLYVVCFAGKPSGPAACVVYVLRGSLRGRPLYICAKGVFLGLVALSFFMRA